MPLCFQSYRTPGDRPKASDHTSNLGHHTAPSRLKTTPRRRISHRPKSSTTSPYSLREISGLVNQLPLRGGVLQKEDMTPSLTCQGEPRQALSLVVNRIPPTTKGQPQDLTSLSSLLSLSPKEEAIIHQESYQNGQNIDVSDSHSIALRGCQDRKTVTECAEKFLPSALLTACRQPDPLPLVSRLLAEGAPVNQVNNRKQSPLHILLSGGIWSTSVKEALRCILFRGAPLGCCDVNGETPLLYVKHFLKSGQYDHAAQVAKELLEAGSDVEDEAWKDQPLLSLSLNYLDDSIELTKILFNYGACVWGSDPIGDRSAFKWVLQAIMLSRKLDNCKQTLKLIGQLMCSQPTRMKKLVIRTINRHSKCYQIYGPLFLGIQIQLKKFWTQPQRLTHLCRIKVRENCEESISHLVAEISLPQIVESYLLLDDASLGEQ